MKTIRSSEKQKILQAQGPYVDLALHTIGWKAFQDMAASICEERLKTRVTIHHAARDGGQDAVFLIPSSRKGPPHTGTVQVKFSHDPKGSLTSSALTPELTKLKKLVDAGEADSYILITNMSVSASTKKQIKDTLSGRGVKKPEVWGKEEVTKTIRESSRLRALVPQVYGLGDLTTILDVRAVDQTRAILRGWLPKLRAYVTTAAHEKAVRVLAKHRIVLLLGNPASGKSTIGAILSTMAVDHEGHSVIQISSPSEFETHWNPNEKNRLFWVDDAFGSNLPAIDYIHAWARMFPKVTAAVNGGNRFLFTSRTHIYRAAYSRLGTRNLSIFKSEDATVNVGDLSTEEKRQILYNHIKHGRQDKAWKTEAKQHLDDIADVENFLPGIAERLGNPVFTKKLLLTKESLYDFMARPEEHLIEVIRELDKDQNAALMLIYVHRGRMNSNNLDEEAVSTVKRITGCDSSNLFERLHELKGSFTKLVSETCEQLWGFEHPTIADAITATLDGQPTNSAAIVLGGPIAKVMSDFACEDGPKMTNTVEIPTKLNMVLNRRLEDVPNNYTMNALLFEFLSSRASDDVVKYQFKNVKDLMHRSYLAPTKAIYNEQFRAAARAHSLGALSDSDRSMISDKFFIFSSERLDFSWLKEDDLVTLIEPSTLLSLGLTVSFRIFKDFDGLLYESRLGIDPDVDIEYQYDVFSSGLELLDKLFKKAGVTNAEDILRSARDRLRDEIDNDIKIIFSELTHFSHSLAALMCSGRAIGALQHQNVSQKF